MKHPYTISALAGIALIVSGPLTSNLNAACAVAVTAEGCMAYAYGYKDIREAVKEAMDLASLGNNNKSQGKLIYAEENGGYGAVAGWIGATGAFAFGASSNGILRDLTMRNALESCAQSGGQKPVIIKVWFDFVGVPEEMIPTAEKGTSRGAVEGVVNAEGYKQNGQTLEGK